MGKGRPALDLAQDCSPTPVVEALCHLRGQIPSLPIECAKEPEPASTDGRRPAGGSAASRGEDLESDLAQPQPDQVARLASAPHRHPAHPQIEAAIDTDFVSGH